MTAFGQIRIVPSADLGNVGPNEGQPSLYQWRWHYALQGLLPWLVVIAAAVGFKGNRHGAILLIVIPLALVNLLYLSIMKALGMTSSSAFQFDILFDTLAMALTLMWLVTPVLRGPGSIRASIALGLMAVMAVLCIFSYGTASSQEATIFLVFLVTLGAVLAFGPVAARRFCRGVYRPGRLTLWLAVWTIFGGVTAVLGTLAILMAILPSGLIGSEVLATILMAMLFGVGVGLALYLMQLPYMLLAFMSPFFRARLQRSLDLKQQDNGGNS